MRGLRDLSIKRKLMVVLMTTTCLALLLACTVFAVLELYRSRQSLVGNLSLLAGIIGENSTAALTFGDQATTRDTLAALESDPHLLAAAILDRDGRTFAVWSRDPGPLTVPAPPERGSFAFADAHLDLYRPIRLGDETIGTVFVRSDLREMRERTIQYAGVAMVVLLGASLAALLLSAGLRRLLSDPILGLAGTARAVSVGRDYSVRAVKHGDDEIGMLTVAFNDMLAQIQARDQALQRTHEDLERRVEARTRELQAEVVERTRAQDELKLVAEKLARSNRELQDFASVASHDLQEPLRKVQMLGDRLQSRCGEALGEQGRDYLARMHNAAARMQVLIDDLLTFSRVTTKAQPFEPVDLGRIAAEVVSDLEARIESTGGTVIVDPLPELEADPTQVRQLLQNLIGNALKFHRPDVPPVVRVSASVERPAEPDATCRLTVEDNGIGFDEKYLDRIFTVFQRLHGRGEYGGTGIGLAVCRRIAERHGGSVTARSRPGAGSTFIVTLPVHQWKGEPVHERV